MKKRKAVTRREKKKILKAVHEFDGQDGAITIHTGRRIIEIKIEDGVAMLPSGKAFEIDARHIC